MAATRPTSPEVESLREQIAHEREQLADDIAAIRNERGIRDALRARLPLLAGAAFAGGFVLGGGIGAAARLVMRRSREGRHVARFGRYIVIDRG